MKREEKIQLLADEWKNLGLCQMLKWTVAYRMKRKNVRLRPKGFREDVLLRVGTSDFFTAMEIKKSYDVSPSFPVKNIIDLGGNIGLTSAYFASKFPKAKIVTVEPEASNFETLKVNVAPYSNIIPVNKGVFHKECYLKIINEEADNNCFNLEESEEPTSIHAISIPSLMQQYGMETIDILKMDIEGGERYLFNEQAHEWLSKVKILMIELHDRNYSGCSKILFHCLEKYDYNLDIRDYTLIIHIDN